MTQVGFGSYRVSHRSNEHKKALEKALDYGCTLIDTSAHFTNGESELLIGEVLSLRSSKPMVITKAGLSEKGEFSFEKESIKKSLDESLKRLKIDSIEGLLIHNPEDYFKKIDSDKEDFYQKLFEVFQMMEELVSLGKIKSYGLSSNTLTSAFDIKDSISMEKIIEFKKSHKLNNLKLVEFPLNLLELGALERKFDGNHLIELLSENSFSTLISRPFNAITEDGLVRLATYKDFAKIDLDQDDYFMNKMSSLVKKFEEGREDEGDHFFDIPLMKQFSEIWTKQPTPDAVEQVYFQYIFPFIAQVFGRNLTPEESIPFYDLYEMSVTFSRKNMHDKAIAFENKAVDMGLLYESDLTLTQKVIEKYSTFGVDYILCGMRKEKYVEELKNYF